MVPPGCWAVSRGKSTPKLDRLKTQKRPENRGYFFKGWNRLDWFCFVVYSPSEEPTMKRAYSYIRFSTTKQMDGDSLRRQTKKTAEYAHRKGFALDESLKLRDLGVSAFKGTNATTGKLGAFIRAVESGVVTPGSVLICESLDRISRSDVSTALKLFLHLMDLGIEIHTLEPEEVFTKQNIAADMTRLITVIVILGRAFEESSTKSYRVKEARNERIDQAKQGKGIITARCPEWLKAVDGKFEPIPERVQVIKQIFKWAVHEGIGQRAIAKRLNEQKIPAFKSKTGWGWAYVRLILTDRRVIGEFNSKDGHSIPGYFGKPIISENDFLQVQAATKKRQRFAGRFSPKVACLFTGIIFDKQSGSSMVYIKKRADVPGRLICSDTEKGNTKGAVSFNYDVFEDYFLKFVAELKVDEIVVDNSVGVLRQLIDELQTQAADTDTRIAVLKEKLETTDDITSVIGVVQKLERKRQDIAKQLIQARAKLGAGTPENQLVSARGLIAKLASTKGDELTQLRLRLRQAIRELVDRIEITIAADGWKRDLMATIRMASGAVRQIRMVTRRGEPVNVSSKPVKGV